MNDLKPNSQQVNKQLLARRRMLKLLGAGAATAVILPETWLKPEVEVGHLPPHAQTSSEFVTLSNAVRAYNGTICSSGSGDEYQMTLDFNSPSGGVIAGTLVTQSSIYNSGVTTSFSNTLTASEISGTAFAGSISYTFCATFATATSVTTTVSLVTPTGGNSNTISTTMSKPSGAPSLPAPAQTGESGG